MASTLNYSTSFVDFCHFLQDHNFKLVHSLKALEQPRTYMVRYTSEASARVAFNFRGVIVARFSRDGDFLGNADWEASRNAFTRDR